MKITNGLVFTKEGFTQRDVLIEKDRIVDHTDDNEVLDAAGMYVIPGLVDIHFHGALGCDFCDGNEESLAKILAYEAEHGVLCTCPATMTYDEGTLNKVMDTARLHRNEKGADLVGINMEGPFISPNKLGAQNPAYVHLPDIDMFHRLQKRSGGLIKLVDIAPEREGSQEFISELHEEVNISLAHTEADYDCAKKAFFLGMRHVTHLYNAMPGLNHRKPGPIVAAMEHQAEAEVIADGIHVHPSMVRLAYTMFGKDKVILISDTMRAAGLEDGEYDLGGQQVKVRGHKAVLVKDENTIAGSVTNLFDCMVNAVKTMDIPLVDAVRSASLNPAISIGVDRDYGTLDVGKYACVLLLDGDLSLVHVMHHGKMIA